MKTYKGNHETGEESTKNDKALRIKYALFIGVAALLIAAAITLTVVFTQRGPADTPGVVTPDPEPEIPIVSTPTYYMPVKDGTVTRDSACDYLVYWPSLDLWKTHEGIDFAAAEGTKVLAIADGTVTDVQKTTLEGTVIIISHKDGLVSVYKSLEEANVVAGDKVLGGQQIGTAGTMLVEASDGIHLHLEVLLNGEYTDPMIYVGAEEVLK